MTKVDDVLSEVWAATSDAPAPLAFNAAVLERIARRRALTDIAFAAMLAFAVWAVAMALGPALAAQAGLLNAILTTPAVLYSLQIVVTGLAVVYAMRNMPVIRRSVWPLVLRR